nr:T9SS type A sorting domain-containing protein [uncultured Draconibacterium sp.]
MKNLFIFVLVVLPFVSFSQTIEIKNFKVLNAAGTSYPAGTKFNFEFDIKGNYNDGAIYMRFYKNSVTPSNCIYYYPYNTDHDYDDHSYYPDYKKFTSWFYSRDGFSTDGITYYLVVDFGHMPLQTFSYTCETTGDSDLSVEIKNFKVLNAAGTNYPVGTKFNFEFDIKGNYNDGAIYMRFYKNSVTPSNCIYYYPYNTDHDYDDHSYYPDYKKFTSWFYSRDGFSTNGITYYLVVDFGHMPPQTFSYTCETTGDPDFSLTNVELPVVDGSTQLPTFDYNNTDVNNIKVTVKNSGGVGKLDKIGWVFTKIQQNSIDNYIYNAVATGVLNSGFANIATGSSHTYDVNINIPYDYYSSGHNIRFMGEFYLCVIVESGAYREAHAEKIYIKDSFKSGLIPISLLKSGSIDPRSKESQSLLVYPNPSEGVFNLELGYNGNYTARVFNLAGQEIWEQKVTGDNKVQIDLKNSAPATYILEVIDQNESVLKKKLIIK